MMKGAVMTTQNKMRLWYTSPAPRFGENTELYPTDASIWEKWSLPLANGYLGACVFGFEDKERIQITENTLANPRLTSTKVPSARYGLNNFAELYVDFGHKNVSDYTRELTLDDATARVSYVCDGVRYQREYFASYPDKVLVMKFSADKAGALTLCACPEIPFLGDYCVEEGDGCGKFGTVVAEGDLITLSGTMEYYNIKFEGQLKVINVGGTKRAEDGKIFVEGADEVIMLFT